MAVQLLIKSPNQQVEDLKIECDTAWTIGNVKEHLSTVYPNNPKKTEQKLIYCGRLLPDNLLLQDINHVGDIHTMHLVCPQSMQNSSESDINQDSLKNTDGVRQRFFDTQHILGPNIPQPQFNYPQINPISIDSLVSNGYITYNMSEMLQLYGQTMTHFFDQLSPGYGTHMANAASFRISPDMYNYPTPTNIPPAPVPDEPVILNPVPENPPQQAPMNNNDDEAAGQDALDWVYILARVGLLLLVLYNYSSLARVMLVISLGLLLCIYRNGVVERQNQMANMVVRIEMPQNQNAIAEGNVDHDSEQVPADVSGSSIDVQNEQGNSEAEETEEEMQQNLTTDSPHVEPSTLSIACTFLTTFFTSLIPEQPDPASIH